MTISDPDLQISSLSSLAAVRPGQVLGASYVVLNASPADAGASVVKFYLSGDQSLDAGDVLLDSRPVPSLPSNDSSSAGTTMTIPAATEVGVYYIIAVADADSSVIESNEANNTRVQAITISHPDLQVSSLSSPAASGPGQVLSVPDVVVNAGLGDADACTMKFYLSVDQKIDAGDVLLGSRAVPPIPSGGSSPGNTTMTIPAAAAAGAYSIIAAVDAEAVIVEADETNNTNAGSITLSYPDLQMSALTISANAGRNITMADSPGMQDLVRHRPPRSASSFPAIRS